ncbi:MAG: hypothetical protein GX443_18905 [Deltaproteobacteria bacterium]|nr:hypothetical protein [Deltaproteobacteria bacterium]
MASVILGSLNRIVHETAKAITDNEIPDKLANVVTSVATTCFGVIKDMLIKIQDLTKQEP